MIHREGKNMEISKMLKGELKSSTVGVEDGRKRERERERERCSNWLPTTKKQAVHPPLLDLRTGFPLRSTVPSCV